MNFKEQLKEDIKIFRELFSQVYFVVIERTYYKMN